METNSQDVDPLAMATLLRSILGLQPNQPLLEERAVYLHGSSERVEEVDVGMWLAWSLAALSLFGWGRMPTMQAIIASAKRVTIAVSMLRTKGNITKSSATLRMSRKALREAMMSTGIYPWTDAEALRTQAQDDAFSQALYGLLAWLPEVVEDGSKGVVWFRPEGDEVGAVWLERGDQSERMFRGWWVDREIAEDYAQQHGHRFHCEGEGESEPDEE